MRLTKIDRKFPLRFSIGAFIFIYILQYPAFRLLNPEISSNNFTIEMWLISYSFVISSSVIFLISLKFGLSGRYSKVILNPTSNKIRKKKPSMWLVILIFGFFAVWSLLMIQLKIGMTIYADFDPLPFKITGFLFYGRLIMQPFILLYIAYCYQKSNYRYVILLLLFALGSWASVASGSRFIAIMFSLPLLLIGTSGRRWIYWFVGVFFFIIIATLSRYFFLPYYINDEYVGIYANSIDQESVIRNVWMLPIGYLFSRTMGIEEVIITLNYGDITPTFTDSLLRLISVFVPFVPTGAGVSQKTIYGLDDEAFGGFGLGFFPNYWVMYGGTLFTYFLGLFISGWFLGRVYLLCTRLFLKLGLDSYFPHFIFVFLFILIFESRSFLFPYLLIASWLAQHSTFIQLFKNFLSLVFSLFRGGGHLGLKHQDALGSYN